MSIEKAKEAARKKGRPSRISCTIEGCAVKAYEVKTQDLDEIVTSTYLQAVEDMIHLMSMNTPVKTVKKPIAYNEGVTSGWYAAKEFIRQSLKQTKDNGTKK